MNGGRRWGYENWVHHHVNTQSISLSTILIILPTFYYKNNGHMYSFVFQKIWVLLYPKRWNAHRLVELSTHQVNTQYLSLSTILILLPTSCYKSNWHMYSFVFKKFWVLLYPKLSNTHRLVELSTQVDQILVLSS